ncbi:MAG: hypothetical protein SFV54_16705 [Bryobacteraceae bacterium]|nr:hypothetical protein [Bryobacteraceae bacterium]
MSDSADKDWSPSNYFNYYTEIEEQFQKARGTGLFLLSPIDWALVEGWKEAGIPLEAVLRGIDAAFEKWRGRKSKTQSVNSLAYCAQAVLQEAQSAAASPSVTKREVEAPFTLEELTSHLRRCREAVAARPGYHEVAEALLRLEQEASQHYTDLEQLEQRLTALEDKLKAVARNAQSEEKLFAARRDLDLQLKPHRGKMTADQLAMLERQFLDRRLLEESGLPRLSLFYIR